MPLLAHGVCLAEPAHKIAIDVAGFGQPEHMHMFRGEIVSMRRNLGCSKRLASTIACSQGER
jgi:hypothetical protein